MSDFLQKMNALRTTLEKFLESEDFKEAVITATDEFWHDRGYRVEFMPDGTWKFHSTLEIDPWLPDGTYGVPHLEDIWPADVLDHVLRGWDSHNLLEQEFFEHKEELKQKMRAQL